MASSRWPPAVTSRIAARQEGDRVLVTVTDTGMGLAGASRPGQGVGLLNVRERLAALFGARGRFTLEDAAPRGARATIEIPAETSTLAASAAERGSVTPCRPP